MRRGIVGMEIAGNGLGLETVEAAEIGNGALEGAASLERIEVADVLAEKNVLADGNGDGVLQMAADGEHGRQAVAHANAERGVATGAAENSGASAGKTNDGIVAGAHDRPVVHQKTVGDVFEASGRFVIRNRDGFVAAVAAGRDQRKSALLHQQVM